MRSGRGTGASGRASAVARWPSCHCRGPAATSFGTGAPPLFGEGGLSAWLTPAPTNQPAHPSASARGQRASSPRGALRGYPVRVVRSGAMRLCGSCGAARCGPTTTNAPAAPHRAVPTRCGFFSGEARDCAALGPGAPSGGRRRRRHFSGFYVPARHHAGAARRTGSQCGALRRIFHFSRM